MHPFLSIVIPTLNEETYLPRLLRDLSKQAVKNFEVIISDGHSEDKTRLKAESYQGNYTIQVVVSDKRNLAYQRNFGARFAKGSYLLFLDADMRIKPRFVEQLVKTAKKHKHLLFLPVHIPENAEFHDELIYNVWSFFVEISQLTEKPFSYGPVVLFEREFFNHMGGYDESVYMYEDHEIIQRTRKLGVHAKLLPDIPVYFSMRRFITEGRFKVLSKYLIVAMHFIAHGKVDKKIFTYEMGGSAPYLLEKKKPNGLAKAVTKYFDKLKSTIEEEMAS